MKIVAFWFFVSFMLSGSLSACEAYIQGQKYHCTLGRSGTTKQKKEGDGATPIGNFALQKVLYRADRLVKPETKLPLMVIKPNMGWCDDIRSPLYNQLIHTPFAFSHEALWRDEHIYDIVVILAYNDHPVVKGNGSAIFLHIARPGYLPTSGCIAFSESDLRAILKKVTPKTRIKIEANQAVFFI